MPEQATAAQPAREPSPIKKEVNEILDHVQKLSTQIAHRAYEIFEENGRKMGFDLAHWLQAESELFHPVHLKVSETPDYVTVRAEVPGFNADEIDVRLEPHRVTIAGKRQTETPEAGKPSAFERCSDQIYRVIDLPAEVATERAVCVLKDGVLKLQLPKAVVAKKVPVETR